MERQGRVYLGMREDSRFYHSGGPLQVFLPGLEHQFYLPRKLLLMAFQEPGSPQEHGRVNVVAAGMCMVPRSGEGKAALFRHLQCIHIPP